MGEPFSLQFEYELPNGRLLQIRQAVSEDSSQTTYIWNSIVKERKYTMGLNLLAEEQEKEFISGLDKRETILVAILGRKIVGYLILTIPDKICRSTLHVAEIGTFVLKKYRGLGIGKYLLTSAVKFAQQKNFEKMVIKVRSSNERALAFYRSKGFVEVGRLKREIKINGRYNDHILMEKFLPD